ncbi:hypothetical protein ACFX13_016406 [Malus domestica]
MMEHGLLPKQEAEKVFEKKQKKSQLQKLNSPMKSSVKTSTKSVTVKKNTPSPIAVSNKKPPTLVSKDASKLSKKQKTEYSSSNDDSDDDFMVASRNITKLDVSLLFGIWINQ